MTLCTSLLNVNHEPPPTPRQDKRARPKKRGNKKQQRQHQHQHKFEVNAVLQFQLKMITDDGNGVAAVCNHMTVELRLSISQGWLLGPTIFHAVGSMQWMAMRGNERKKNKWKAFVCQWCIKSSLGMMCGVWRIISYEFCCPTTLGVLHIWWHTSFVSSQLLRRNG